MLDLDYISYMFASLSAQDAGEGQCVGTQKAISNALPPVHEELGVEER